MLTSGALAGFRETIGRTHRAIYSLFFCILLLAGGCKQAHFDGVEYRDSDVAFRLGRIPEGMREIYSDDAKVTLHDEPLGTMIAIAARCGEEADDVPLRALVQHLFLQFTDRQLISEETYMLDGRRALEMELTARLDGVPRHFVVVVLKKDGCVYDMYHVDGGGDGAALLASRADFRKMVEGFRTLH